MKVFSFSPPGLLSQCSHTRVAAFLSTLLKGSDWVGILTALEDIKHPASLWSYPAASSWVLCFSCPVHHILLVEFSLLQTLGYLFHKGKGVLDRKWSSFSVGESKRTYHLFHHEKSVLTYWLHVCRHSFFTNFCYVFNMLNIFVKWIRLYLRKPTETQSVVMADCDWILNWWTSPYKAVYLSRSPRISWWVY